MDCCKEELPFILPSEVTPVQQNQQQHEAAAEPQSSSDGNNVSGEAEQMSSTDQTAGDVTEATAAEQTNMTDVSVDPAPSTSVQEDVVEPMELDHQTAIPTATIIPTGNGIIIFTWTITFAIIGKLFTYYRATVFTSESCTD